MIDGYVEYLKYCINYYNTHPEVTKEELYEDIYEGRNSKEAMRQGRLEKFLTR